MGLTQNTYTVAAQSCVDWSQRGSATSLIAFGRMLAMYLCRLITGASLARIGDAFHRDHTTVLYAIRHIESTVVQRPTFQEAVRLISERVKGRLGLAYTLVMRS